MSAFELIIIRDEPESDISLLVDDEQYTLVVINDPPEHEIAVQEVSDNEFEMVILLDNVVVNNYYGGEGAGKVTDETPLGLIDGSNVNFTTLHHFISESLIVSLNGLTLTRIHDFYVTGPNSFQLTASPQSDEIIRVNYLKS